MVRDHIPEEPSPLTRTPARKGHVHQIVMEITAVGDQTMETPITS